MPKLIVRFLLALGLAASAVAHARSGRQSWAKASPTQRVQLLDAYQTVLTLAPDELAEWQAKKALVIRLFPTAHALASHDCIYAGWPSRSVQGKCSSPARVSDRYEAGGCDAATELHCQPLLFGPGLCASVKTSAQRSLAFNQCRTQFDKQNRSLAGVIETVLKNNQEAQLLELFDFGDRICSQGRQASTPMCHRLKDLLASLAAELAAEKASASQDAEVGRETSDVATELQETVELTTETLGDVATVAPQVPGVECEDVPALPRPEPKPESTQERETPSVAVTTTQAPLTLTATTPSVVARTVPVGRIVPFAREVPRPLDFELTTKRPATDPFWNNRFVKDKNDPELRPTGFEFAMTGPNALAGRPLDPNEKVERTWAFVSSDHSRRESYLWITDDAGSGRLSQLMESVLVFLPRKTLPQIEAAGEEVRVTLPTAEQVIYDKRTRLIKSGALSEGAIDLLPDRHNRRFAPVTYHGTGIMIRADKRGEDPRLIPGNATVTQGSQRCQIKASLLWNSDAEFRFASDDEALRVINQNCGNKFRLEP